MAQHDLQVKFWGVRGSYPVPGVHTAKYGGNTSCIEIRNHKHLVILDAGTGIIPLGEKIISEYESKNQKNQKLHITVLLTHTHHDHIQGLPFFKPAYQNFCELYIYGPQLLGEDLQETLRQTMEPRFCPVRLEEMSSEKVIVNMAETDKLLFQHSGQAPILQNGRENIVVASDDLVIRAHRSYAHPKDGVFVFKISMNGKCVVYATDIEGYSGGDSRLIQFAQNADLLIHDAQYEHAEYADSKNSRQGFGHSTIDMACEVAEKASVKQLILFHHDPTHTDEQMDRIEKYAAAKFNAVIAGKEGMEICI
jgi:phosphoribosyl 1,2-cyclic phosphodiesterase